VKVEGWAAVVVLASGAVDEEKSWEEYGWWEVKGDGCPDISVWLVYGTSFGRCGESGSSLYCTISISMAERGNVEYSVSSV
jgi:hypothetical protein